MNVPFFNTTLVDYTFAHKHLFKNAIATGN